MRILHISHNHHIVGGSDRVFFETTRLLERAGHQVVPFCMANARNLPSQYSAYFPKGADSAAPKVLDSAQYFYNADAKVKLKKLLDDEGPFDLAHLHIYHGKQTPAILPVLRGHGIPVVQSLHEYKLACPVYTLQRNGANCQLCVSGSKLNSVLHRCKDRSFLKSAVMAAEMATSRILGDVRLVDRFICVSDFQRQIMQRAGIAPEKLTTLHNFVDQGETPNAFDPNGYLLYFGRIEELKGLKTLIRAVVQTGHTLAIAGDGGWVPDLKALIAGQSNIRFVGFQSGDELNTLINGAGAVVVPSEWYENCPMSLLEAKSRGKPIIGARIGGIPELIRDGVDGVLFSPGDEQDLRRALMRFQRGNKTQMSNAAFMDARARFSGDAHLTQLLAVYAAAMRASDGALTPQTA